MFKDLPGHYQRALLNEAEIRYNGHQMSKYCRVNSNKEEFISNTVESLEKDVKKYVIKDSRTLYLFPLERIGRDIMNNNLENMQICWIITTC